MMARGDSAHFHDILVDLLHLPLKLLQFAVTLVPAQEALLLVRRIRRKAA